MMTDTDTPREVSFSRLKAVSRDVAYLATQPEGQELGTPFVALCQFYEGEWSYETFDIAVSDMALFRAPDTPHRVLYLLGERGETVDVSTKKKEVILPENSPLYKNHRLGYLLKIRQLGRALIACGDGAQVHIRGDDGQWKVLDETLLDGIGLSFLELGVMRKKALQSGQGLEAYKQAGLANRSSTLWGLGGAGEDDIYVCSEKSQVFHYDGSAFREVPVSGAKGRALLDILVETPERVWICGRDGVLLLGNHRDGFTNLNPARTVDGWPNFNGMTLFQGTLYLSSYADPRGLFRFDGQHLSRVRSGLTPDIDDVAAVDAAGGMLWVMGHKDLLRFDGVSWERIAFPGNDPVR